MTNDRPTYDDLAELLVPYSLGLLGDSEQQTVREALATSPALRAELEEIETVGGQIARGLPHVPAPASLKASVMASIPFDSLHHADRDVAQLSSRRRGRARFALPVFTGAMAAACVALGLVAFGMHGDLQDTKADLRDARSGSLPTAGSADSVLADAPMRTVATRQALAPTHGTLVRFGSRYVLLLKGMPHAGVGRSWQVWTRDTTGVVRNVGVWASNDADQALVLDRTDVREVMVSLEPQLEPASAPSGAPMATVSV